MRRIVALIIAIAAVLIVVRSGVLQKTFTTTTSPSPMPGPVTTSPKPVGQPAGDPASGQAPKPVVPRASDPAVATAIDELLAAWEPINSVYATVETKIPDAAGHKGTTRGKGRYWLKKKDGQLLIHFDLRNELRIKEDPKSMLVTAEELVTTIDGKYLYKLINQPSHKEASQNKLNYNDVLQIAGPYLLSDLVANNKLTLLPEEMRYGRALKVIKATPNDGSRESIHSFDKASGIRLEMHELDEQGNKTLEIMLTEVNINAEISEDQFKPVIPEGVTLEDRTTPP